MDRERLILYLCDRKRCTNCYEECRHTSSREHALHPDLDPDKDRLRFTEIIDNEYWEND